MIMYGKTDWFFPDAELPPRGKGEELIGHESFILFNPNQSDAEIRMSLYFTDRPPLRAIAFTLPGERVKCVRSVEAEGLLGLQVPVGEQYAVAINASSPIVAQYGRLDMRTGSMAFYTTPGYAQDTPSKDSDRVV